jgi:hypothetical protein
MLTQYPLFMSLDMRMLSIVSVLLCLLFQTEVHAAKPRQGIRGQVVWKAGNQMPSPDRPPSQAKGVKREVWIYELTRQDQVTSDEGFYGHFRTKRIRKVVTDSRGRFSAALPPGRYSVFTKEPKGLWANITDGDSNLYPVTVEKGKWTEIRFEINYAAAF